MRYEQYVYLAQGVILSYAKPCDKRKTYMEAYCSVNGLPPQYYPFNTISLYKPDVILEREGRTITFLGDVDNIIHYATGIDSREMSKEFGHCDYEHCATIYARERETRYKKRWPF